jgi:alcohol dehydrogenase class IV
MLPPLDESADRGDLALAALEDICARANPRPLDADAIDAVIEGAMPS